MGPLKDMDFSWIEERMMAHMLGQMTSNVEQPTEPLTLDAIMKTVRDLPPPLPRLVPVYPFYTTEVYTGHDLLKVAEPNPIYDMVPAGMTVQAETLTLDGRGEKVCLARADEMAREGLLNPFMLYSV